MQPASASADLIMPPVLIFMMVETTRNMQTDNSKIPKVVPIFYPELFLANNHLLAKTIQMTMMKAAIIAATSFQDISLSSLIFN